MSADHDKVADALKAVFDAAEIHRQPAALLGRVEQIIASAADRQQDALDAYADARLAFVECLGVRKIRDGRNRQAVLAALNKIRSIESRREIFRRHTT